MELIMAIMIFLGGQFYSDGEAQQRDAAKIGGGQVGIVVPDPEEI